MLKPLQRTLFALAAGALAATVAHAKPLCTIVADAGPATCSSGKASARPA